MQYQLWAIADGKPVNAGMYTEEKDSKVALSKIPKAQAFAITLKRKRKRGSYYGEYVCNGRNLIR